MNNLIISEIVLISFNMVAFLFTSGTHEHHPQVHWITDPTFLDSFNISILCIQFLISKCKELARKREKIIYRYREREGENCSKGFVVHLACDA